MGFRRRAGSDLLGVGVRVLGPLVGVAPDAGGAGPAGLALAVGGERQHHVGLGAGAARIGLGHELADALAGRAVAVGEGGRALGDGRRAILGVPGEGAGEAGRHVAGRVPGEALGADGHRGMGMVGVVGVDAVAVAVDRGEARAEVVPEVLRAGRIVEVGRLGQAIEG